MLYLELLAELNDHFIVGIYTIVPSPENASSLDFDLLLFCEFFNSGSASLNRLQSLLSCLCLPFVVLSAFC